MLNDNIKSLITTTIALYNSEKITQNIIEEGLLKLKEAVKLIKEQQEVTPIEKLTTPVTLEELEAKFQTEPKYPDLQLRDDYDLEVNLKTDLLTLNAAEGTIVKTNGYYAINDGGQAVYEIMSYDDWWNQLPIDLKLTTYHNDRIGVNPMFYKNPVDNFGNHKLNNGMVAKLLPNLDGYVRTEQWGLFEGRYDNCRALVHCFANNTRNCKILFPKNKTYTFYDSWVTEVRDRKDEIFFTTPKWVNLDNVCNNGNEYALIHNSRRTASPMIGNARNLEICGNGSTFRWGNGQVNSAFGFIECGGFIDGLKIHGLVLDGNFKEQLYQRDKNGNIIYEEKKISDNFILEMPKEVVTRAHGISYFSSGFNCSSVTSDGYIKDGNDKNIGIKSNDLQNYLGVEDTKKTTFNNVEIYGCTIKNVGTKIDVSDSGGDCILIINPIECNNVNVHNNKFLNWGRWAYAIDLGGSGERFYNHSFVQNICVQDKDNFSGVVDSNGAGTAYRGLGWIDFEARKCFTNLNVSENYVYGANGWAFNGNGKVSENIKIERNHIERPSYNWRSIYPYAFTFYSVYSKDLTIKHNIVNGGSIGFGKLFYNTVIENNKFIGTGAFDISNPFKNVLIKDNIGEGTRGQLFSLKVASLAWVNDENSEFYIPEEGRVTTVIFENNGEGGICGNIINTDNDLYKNNISLIFRNNTFRKFNVNCLGIKDYQFTPDQLYKGDMAWSARGCKVSNAVISRSSDNPVPGGLYYKEGDLVTSTLSNVTRLYSPNYFESAFPQLKNNNGSIKKDMDIYCVAEGVFPFNGEFLMCDGDIYFTVGSKRSVGNFIYTLDNLYYVTVAGTLGDVEPTHTEGIAVNGTCELLWVAPIARYEMRNK